MLSSRTAQRLNMITIIGPTASGKTALAAKLAYHLGSEVISADSRQVYQGMDIGTGKDLSDYVVDGKAIPYHLIDICPAGTRYNLYEYQRDFHLAFADILSRGVKEPILCGGTGLYVESVLRGYNLPEAPENSELRERLKGKSFSELTAILHSYDVSNRQELDTAQRVIRAIEVEEYKRQYTEKQDGKACYEAVPSVIFCLDLERESRRKKISDRLQRRLNEGMTSEVESLLASGISPDALIYYGLEYKWVTLYVTGQINFKTMAEQLEIAIHQFAKRQMTWFRGMERRGLTLNYIDALLPMDDKIELICNKMGICL